MLVTPVLLLEVADEVLGKSSVTPRIVPQMDLSESNHSIKFIKKILVCASKHISNEDNILEKEGKELIGVDAKDLQ